MKTLKHFLLFLLLGGPMMTFAQTGKYEAAMQKALSSLDSAENTSALLATANQFERISGVAAKEWLPLYYTAYSNLLAGIMSADAKQKDQLYDKALQQINAAGTLSPENSEIWTVKGYAQFMKMAVDPMSRMALMSAANTSLEKAKKLDPANPRPWFVQGQNTFYTPEAFGGGKKPATSFLENAVKLYESAKNAAPFAPSWGKQRAAALFAQCK